ncbi:MAG: hypothetical protein J0I41_07670 [Filimonas sp.]|nr:hypothetical protein [Filimonas sp.]
MKKTHIVVKCLLLALAVSGAMSCKKDMLKAPEPVQKLAISDTTNLVIEFYAGDNNDPALKKVVNEYRQSKIFREKLNASIIRSSNSHPVK